MKSFSDYIVDRNAIRKNLLEYKKHDNKSLICSVVKADGYGVGVENIVCSIDDKTDFYAVACFEEAVKLRKLTQKPILILNFVDKTNFEYCSQNNISISVGNLQQLSILKKISSKIKIHFAINTGMNRIGFKSKNEFFKAVEFVYKYKNKIIIEGIFTHFFDSKDINKTKKQFSIFMQYIDILKLKFDTNKIIKHSCASISAIKYPKFRLDMVRLGIILYGSCDGIKNFNSKRVLTIRSKIINICSVKNGEYVGYSSAFVAKKDMIVATVPLGYADGILRSYAKRGYVLCNKNKCKILGNVCMDMCMIDVTGLNVKLFDNVIIIGSEKKYKIDVDDIAKNCNTISYEILTGIKRNRFNLKFKAVKKR